MIARLEKLVFSFGSVATYIPPPGHRVSTPQWREWYRDVDTGALFLLSPSEAREHDSRWKSQQVAS